MVHFNHLSTKEAAKLSNYFCLQAKKKGWVGIQSAYFPYYDAKPFQKAKFIFFGKKLFMDIAAFKDIVEDVGEIKSIYIDWR